MKQIFILTAVLLSTHSFAANNLCSTQNPTKKALKFFKELPQTFFAIETEPQSLAKTLIIEAGQKLTTTAGQKITLTFYMPLEQKIIIDQNSDVEISQLPTENCFASFYISKGRISAEAWHEKRLSSNNCADLAEVHTDNVEIFPTGTKYSVDLSSAIAEANGDTVRDENFEVEKGGIEVRIKKIRKIKIKSASLKSKQQRVTKLSKQSKTNKLKIKNNKKISVAKNNSFKLRAKQKAKLKINQKTKFADLEVEEP